MVPQISIIFMGISAVIALILPFALFAIFRKSLKLKFSHVIIGAITFVLAVLVLEGLMHVLILGEGRASNLISFSPYLYALYGGLMAGVFEETARYIVFKFIMKKASEPSSSLAYGIGHGGIESIILAALPMFVIFFMSLSYNASGGANVINQALANTIDAAKNTQSITFLYSGIERISAVTVHIALSVFVWASVKREGYFWLYPIAILAHAGVDFLPALVQTTMFSIPLSILEAVTALWALGLAIIAYRFFKKLMLHEETQETLENGDF